MALQFRQKVAAVGAEFIAGYPESVRGVVYKRVVSDAVRESPELILRMHPRFKSSISMCKRFDDWFSNLTTKIRRTSMGNLDGLMAGQDSCRRAFYYLA